MEFLKFSETMTTIREQQLISWHSTDEVALLMLSAILTSTPPPDDIFSSLEFMHTCDWLCLKLMLMSSSTYEVNIRTMRKCLSCCSWAYYVVWNVVNVTRVWQRNLLFRFQIWSKQSNQQHKQYTMMISLLLLSSQI